MNSSNLVIGGLRNIKKRFPGDFLSFFTQANSAIITESTLGIVTNNINNQNNKNSNQIIQNKDEKKLDKPDSRDRTTCKAKYGTRSYLEESNSRLPPMLYTFPGSGNTWCRLLIEHATGILTGSVYNDKTLLEALPGEFKCNWQVSAVKVHPHTHTFDDLRTGRFHSDDGKCKRGKVQKFERAILLIRNPFDSIWSEFQRRYS